MKLLAKEWQQQKWLFLIGSLAGITFPAFVMFLSWQDQSELGAGDMGLGVVLTCGALFAIILSTATTFADTRKGLDSFWQSKPIRPRQLLGVKFALGAVLLLITFVFVISLDLWRTLQKGQGINPYAWSGLCYTYPIALVMFAATMLLVVVLRDPAKAFLLAIWLALLIYFLPLLVGGLEWMNIFVQMDSATQRPSLAQYVVGRLFSPEGIGTGAASGSYRWSSMPYAYYSLPLYTAIRIIVHSPQYLQYLFFVAASLLTSAACVALSVLAVKRNWRWQPGQKTIVWTLGASAAFIFGVAMLQTGHNLEPVRQWQGKELVNPAIFNWDHMPPELRQGLPEGEWIAPNHSYFDRNSDAVCIKDDFMLRISCGYQGAGYQEHPDWNAEVKRHFVLQVYRFPYEQNDWSIEAPNAAQNFVAGVLRIKSTELIQRNFPQTVLGCFVKGDYLYTAYRPQLRTHKNNRIDLKNMPIYFAAIDISNPEQPTLVDSIDIEPTVNFTAGFANHGQLCYLSDGGQLTIISLAQADKPEIVRRIRYVVGAPQTDAASNNNDDYSLDLGDDPGFPSHSFSVVSDKLLCNSYTRVAILDLAQPTKPRVIFDEYFDRGPSNIRGVIRGAAYSDNHLYLANDNGLYVIELTKQADGTFSGKLIGNRKATPLEKLAGRRPFELLFHNGYLIEGASGFGVIAYDLSDPTRPRRAYHTATPGRIHDIGIWNNLLFTQSYNFQVHFFDIPPKQ